MFTLVFFLLLISVLLLVTLKQVSSRKRNLPPSPPRLPIVGNLHQLGSLPHVSLHLMSQKHGDLMLLYLGSAPTLVVSSAEAAQQVLKTQDLSFASRPFLSVANEFFYECKDVAFCPYGEHWRQAKKICTLHLLSVKRVRSYHAVRAEEVASMVEKITRWGASGPVNLSEILNSLSNEIISRAAVGKKYFEQEVDGRNEFCSLVGEMSACLGEFSMEDAFPYLSWIGFQSSTIKRARRCFRKLDDFLEKMIAERVKSGSCTTGDHDGNMNEDFVDVLLSLKNDHTMDYSLTMDSIKAIVMEMFAAGTETSYVILEWAMAELIRTPHAMEKAQEEARRIIRNTSEINSEVEINQMTYLDAIIKEVFRLHPPFPLLVPRESVTDTEIFGYHIPSKTRVLINVWALGKDLRYWEAPGEFNPARFLGVDVDYKGQDFNLIPFGSGRRICPGISFAISTIKLALIHLLGFFDWELPYDLRGGDLDMTEAAGITTRMKKPLVVVARPTMV